MKPYLLTASYAKDDTEITACLCFVAADSDLEAQLIGQCCNDHESCWNECEAEEINFAKDKYGKRHPVIVKEEN